MLYGWYLGKSRTANRARRGLIPNCIYSSGIRSVNTARILVPMGWSLW